MTDPQFRGESEGRSPRTRRVALDGLVVNRREVWVLVGREDDDPVDLLLGIDGESSGCPLRVCREVLDDGRLLIGDPDPDQDQLLSELLRREDCGNS